MLKNNYHSKMAPSRPVDNHYIRIEQSSGQGTFVFPFFFLFLYFYFLFKKLEKCDINEINM